MKNKMTKKDFPFLENHLNLCGLSVRVYSGLCGAAKIDRFESKDQILQFLKGKSIRDLFRMRNIGIQSLEEIRKWTIKEIGNE